MSKNVFVKSETVVLFNKWTVLLELFYCYECVLLEYLNIDIRNISISQYKRY